MHAIPPETIQMVGNSLPPLTNPAAAAGLPNFNLNPQMLQQMQQMMGMQGMDMGMMAQMMGNMGGAGGANAGQIGPGGQVGNGQMGMPGQGQGQLQPGVAQVRPSTFLAG